MLPNMSAGGAYEMRGRQKECMTGYIFILPILLLFAVFIVYPILYNIYVSFFDWNGIDINRTFVGLQNYYALMKDPVIPKTIFNFLILALFTTAIQAILGILFAAMFYRRIPLQGFYRIMFYLPVIATPTIVGDLFSKIFETNRGYLNLCLRALNMDYLCQQWLASSKTAIICIVFVNIWQWTGYSMLMYYSNMLAIPEDLYESAEIDGASVIQRFRYITVPILRKTHFTLVILGILGALKCFDLPYVLTRGGPAHATETLSTYIYMQSFSLFKQGKASTIAVLMLLIALILTLIQLRMYVMQEQEG